MDTPSIHIIHADQYRTSDWTGGQTTEIFIFPEGSAYAHRDFLFRVSAARVMVSPSDFTLLEDYDRILMSTENPVELQQQGASLWLEPFIPYAFSGTIPTHCIGTTADFNVMMRKDNRASLELISFEELYEAELAPNAITLFYVAEAQQCLTCNDAYDLMQKDSLVIDGRIAVNNKTILFKTTHPATLYKVVMDMPVS